MRYAADRYTVPPSAVGRRLRARISGYTDGHGFRGGRDGDDDSWVTEDESVRYAADRYTVPPSAVGRRLRAGGRISGYTDGHSWVEDESVRYAADRYTVPPSAVGRRLRARISGYTDGHGSGKTAQSSLTRRYAPMSQGRPATLPPSRATSTRGWI